MLPEGCEIALGFPEPGSSALPHPLPAFPYTFAFASKKALAVNFSDPGYERFQSVRYKANVVSRCLAPKAEQPLQLLHRRLIPS
jgi:hypothetical protein